MRTPASLDNTDAPSATYAHGNVRDDAVPGDLTGTPLTREWLGDIYHGSLEIIDRAGITPSEAAETSLASDLADAVDSRANSISNTNISSASATASTASKLVMRDASGNATAKQLISDIADGTAPLVVTSTTKVTNLNADLLDGNSSAAFGTATNEDILLDFRSYDATRTYALNDPVFYNGVPYKSLQNSNTGNTPDVSLTYWEATGGSASDPLSPDGLWNIGIAASVAANALTIALKQRDGTTDPTTGVGKCRVSFRSSTITSGAFTTVDITSAMSTVISSGSTAGHMSGTANFIYVYLLNNAGTAELAWCSTKVVDEKRLYSTTAEGGAGAADGPNTIYSTTARSNVPMRLIGCISVNQETAGTWATAPSAVYVGNDMDDEFTQYVPIFTGFGTVTNVYILRKKLDRETIIEGRFTCGTPTADPCNFTMPHGTSCGGLTNERYLVGDIVRVANAGPNRLYAYQGTNTIRVGGGSSSHGDLAGNSFTGAGELFYFRCVVPTYEY